jgi:hypothetical protein
VSDFLLRGYIYWKHFLGWWVCLVQEKARYENIEVMPYLCLPPN